MSRHKYHARPTEVDGIRFASKREAKRYGELRLLEKQDKIVGLLLQPKYDLVVNGQKICTYVADFRYWDQGILVVEDAKGFKTRDYKLKRKLMKAIHGIDIREV